MTKEPFLSAAVYPLIVGLFKYGKSREEIAGFLRLRVEVIDKALRLALQGKGKEE